MIASTEVFRLDSFHEQDVGPDYENAWAVFPITRLRPEQVVHSIQQAASLPTANQNSHVIMRLVRASNESDFVRRYGDAGEDELADRGGTIPQRLLMMNGNLVKDYTKNGLLSASTQIAHLAPDDCTAIETAYLTVLTRQPSGAELNHFEQQLSGTKGQARVRELEDLYWTLINATEFSWNH